MSRPWREVKSRRGAPKRVNTEGEAVPTSSARTSAPQTLLFMRLFGDGKHGQAEQIQTFRGPACRTTFTCPSLHALLSSENPFPCRIAIVLSALAEGLDPSAAERVFGYRQATITSLSLPSWRARTNSA
jgi:hypothetical protein